MTEQEYKFDQNIIDTTYRWASELEENALFDLFLVLSAAFRLSDIKDTSVYVASQLKGLQKIFKERYNEEETKNVLMNGISFGEKVKAACAASAIANHVLTELIPGAIHRKNSEAPDENLSEYVDDFDKN
ncbi:MAG: hypothetical protein ACTSW7_01570 [Candidatus Thorarchaeota archaeon]|nr:hypothetical protein [Thermoplasmatales archaeon]